jgi:hypothetical protein
MSSNLHADEERSDDAGEPKNGLREQPLPATAGRDADVAHPAR